MGRWIYAAACGLWSATVALPAHAADTSYTYDALGRLTAVAYTCGKSVAYSYDAAGNRTSVVTAGGNASPVANADSIAVVFNTAKNFDPRVNDTDADCDALTITATGSGPSHGGVTINGGTSITYTPTTGYSGADSFSYTISDPAGHTASATVSVTVAPANQPPAAVNDSITTPKNTAKTFDPRVNDSDPEGDALTITGTSSGPSHGTAAVNSGVSITYTPTTGYSGSDSFNYTISDGHGGTATATVSVTVTGNTPPVAVNDGGAIQKPPQTFKTLDPRINDSDADGDPLSVIGVGTPTFGTVTFTATSVTFTPGNTYGSSSFTYTISDGSGGTATATVTIAVINPG